MLPSEPGGAEPEKYVSKHTFAIFWQACLLAPSEHGSLEGRLRRGETRSSPRRRTEGVEFRHRPTWPTGSRWARRADPVEVLRRRSRSSSSSGSSGICGCTGSDRWVRGGGSGGQCGGLAKRETPSQSAAQGGGGQGGGSVWRQLPASRSRGAIPVVGVAG
jgi:hypothetical protein